MKKTKLYAKKTLSVFMAVMMLMTAWVFVPSEHNHAEAASATDIASANQNKVTELNGLDFGTGFTTTSGNFQGDNATTMANRGYYKNTLYSPHFPASNNNLTNNDAGVYFGTLGGTADGARVWYPNTTLIWDGVTTPQIPILFDIDSNNDNRVGVKNVYISSGANGLAFSDSYWTAKSECAKDTNYYTHFTFDWIMQNNSGNFWISTSSGNDKESMCSKKGYWDIYGTYLQYTGGSFGSGSNYYKDIKPTWVCRTGSNYTGTTRNTIYVIDYVPLKNALAAVQGIKNSITSAPGKYTTASVSAFVEAAKKLVAAKPNNYINSGKNDVSGWNTAVSNALSAWNSAKNLAVQTYTLKFIDFDGNVKHEQTSPYGTAVNCTNIAAGLGNTIKQHNDQYHQTYQWDLSGAPSTLVDDVVINESPAGTVAHIFGDYTQDDASHTRTCSVCQYVQTQAHIKGTGYVTKAETCTEDGVMTYDCSTCGKKAIETSVINNITGHDFNEIVIKDEGENGAHWRKCSRCDAYGWAGTVNNSEKHNWDKNGDTVVDASDAVESKPSTCQVAGYEKYECKTCKATWTKTLELAKHTITETAAKDVTNQCGGDGNAAFWSCSVCNRVWKDEALTDELADTTDADGDGIPDALETKGPEHDFTGMYVNAANGADGNHYRQCTRFTQCRKYGLMVDGAPVEGETEPHEFTSTETASTCTVQGTKTYTCSDCGHSYTEKLPLAAHTMTHHEAKEAKCGEAGNVEYYSCSVCNKNYKDNDGSEVIANVVIPALTHKWSAHHAYDKLKTAATCQSPAVYYNNCDYCKVQLEDTHPYGEKDTENGHSFNGTETQKNDDGTHSFKCTVKGCTEYGNATACTYEKTKDVPSTCKTKGYTTYICSVCGNGYTDWKQLDTANHEGGTEIRDALEATCSTDGYTGDTYCLGCDTKIADGEVIKADKTNHKHENMKDYASQASTCQAAGWKAYRYCDKCDTYEIEKETLPKLSHKFTTYKSNNNGTHTAECSTCNEAVAPKATDTKNCAGGTANCVDLAKCSVCNGEYGTVNKANHKTVVTVKRVSPTCQTEGTEAYSRCDACNTDIDEIEKIDKLSHEFSEWSKVAGKDEHTRSCKTCDPKVGAVATETESCKGGTAYCNALAKCSVCNAEYGKLDANNHKTTSWTLVGKKAATCTEEGYTGDKIRDCCKTVYEKGSAIEKLKHEYTVEVEGSRVAATCIKEGTVTFKCANCDATKVTKLEKDYNNHASDEEIIIGAYDASCTEEGFTGNVYHACCYSDEEGADNSKALIRRGEKIKPNGRHELVGAVPEYMLDLDAEGNAVIIEKTDENGKIVKSLKVISSEPDYETKKAARRDDGKWYHAQICEQCGDVVYEACYTYEHTYNCVETDICEVCDGLCSLKDADKHKEKLTAVEGTAATCMATGTKTYYKCEHCKVTYLDEAGKKPFDLEKEADKLIIPKTGHTFNWDKPDSVVPGTCGTPGSETFICTVEGCNESTTISTGLAANEHTWNTEYEVTDEPTCGSNGYEAIKCTVCGAVKPGSYVTIPATGEHNYDADGDGDVDRDDAVATPGTSCTDPGKLTYTCQNEGCGNKLVEDDSEGTYAHKWSDWVKVGGDCSTGVIMERKCTVAGCNATEQDTIESDTHSFELKAYVEPTKEKDGYKLYVCANCGEESREDIPYTGSGEGGEGGEGGETPDTPDQPTDEHLIDEELYETVKEATCKSPEIRRYVCMRCGETVEKEYGEPLEHVWLEQPAEIATCTKPGKIAHYKCVRCEALYKYTEEQIIIKQLDHFDGDGNGKCDECNSAFYGEGENSKTCGCICHKENFLMKIIYKILNFFWKLFKIGRTCDCGAVHY